VSHVFSRVEAHARQAIEPPAGLIAGTELAPFAGVFPAMVTRYLIAVTLVIGLARAIPLLTEARRAQEVRLSLAAPQPRIVTGCFGYRPANLGRSSGVRYLGDAGANLLASTRPDLNRQTRRTGPRFR
jgi:hypothetical protein